MPQAERTDWETPPELFAVLQREFGPFTLDPCAAKGQHTATEVKAAGGRYFTLAEDGLSQPWSGVVYLNPPYGRELGKWTAKARYEVCREGVERIVGLLPVRSDTRWWHRDVEGRAYVRLLKGRVRFVGGSTGAPPFPSCVVVWGPMP